MQNLLQRDLGSSLLSIAIILGWLGLFFVRYKNSLFLSYFMIAIAITNTKKAAVKLLLNGGGGEI